MNGILGKSCCNHKFNIKKKVQNLIPIHPLGEITSTRTMEQRLTNYPLKLPLDSQQG